MNKQQIIVILAISLLFFGSLGCLVVVASTESVSCPKTIVASTENCSNIAECINSTQNNTKSCENYTCELNNTSLENNTTLDNNTVVLRENKTETFLLDYCDNNDTDCDTANCDNLTNESNCTDYCETEPVTNNDNCSNNNNCSPVNETIAEPLIYPTYAELIAFLAADNTDKANLPDNDATVSVARGALEHGNYHNQIILLLFDTGQLFAVNRFALEDGSIAYVDCSSLTGSNGAAISTDRILTAKKGQPITAVDPFNNGAVYEYPEANVTGVFELWSV